MGNSITLKGFELDSFNPNDDDDWLKKPCSSFWDRDVLQKVNNTLHSMFDYEIIMTEITPESMNGSLRSRASKKSRGYTCNRQVISDIYQVLGISEPLYLDADGKSRDLSFRASLNDKTSVFTSSDLVMLSSFGLHRNNRDIYNDDFKQRNNFCQYKSIDESGMCNVDDDIVRAILSEQSNILLKEAPKASCIHGIIASNMPNNMHTAVLQLQNRLRRRALLRLHLAIQRHSTAKAPGDSSSTPHRKSITASPLIWRTGVFRKASRKCDSAYQCGSAEASADLIIATSLTSSISIIAGLRDQLLKFNLSGRDSSDIASLYNTQMRRLSTSLLNTLSHATPSLSSETAVHSSGRGIGRIISPVIEWNASSSSSQLDFYEVGGTACVRRKEGALSNPTTVWAKPTGKVSSLAFVVTDLRAAQLEQQGVALSVGICLAPSGFPRSNSDGLGKHDGSWGIVDDRAADSGSTIFASTAAVGSWRKFKNGDVVVLMCDFIENYCEISVNLGELCHRFELPSTGDASCMMGATLSGDNSLRIIPVSMTRLNPAFSTASQAETPLLRVERIMVEAPLCAKNHPMVALNSLPPTYVHQHSTSLVAVNCNKCLRSGIQEDAACFFHCSECSYDFCFCCSAVLTSASATRAAPEPPESAPIAHAHLFLKRESPLAAAAQEQLALLFREDIIFSSVSSAIDTAAPIVDHPRLDVSRNPFIRKYMQALEQERLSSDDGAHRGSMSLSILFCLSVLQHSLAGVLEVVHFLLDRSLDEGGRPLLLLERANFAAEHLLRKSREGEASRCHSEELLFATYRAPVDRAFAASSQWEGLIESSFGRPDGQAVYLMSLLAKISSSADLFCIDDDHIFGVLLDMLDAAVAALACSFIESVWQQQAPADPRIIESRKLQVLLGGYALVIIHHSIAKLTAETSGSAGIGSSLDSPLPEEPLSLHVHPGLSHRLRTARRVYDQKLDPAGEYPTLDAECAADLATGEGNTYRGRIAFLLDLIIMNPIVDPDTSLIANYAVRLAVTRHIISASPSDQFERIMCLLGSAQAGNDTPSERALCMQWMGGLEGPNVVQLLQPPLDGALSSDGDRFLCAMLSLADNALCGKCKSLCAPAGEAQAKKTHSSALQEQVLRVLEPIAIQSIGSLCSSVLSLAGSGKSAPAERVKGVISRLVRIYKLLITSAKESISTIVDIFSRVDHTGGTSSVGATFELVEQVVNGSHVGSLVPLSLLSLTVLWRDLVALGHVGLCDRFVSLSEQLKQLGHTTCSAMALKEKINPSAMQEVVSTAAEAASPLLPERLKGLEPPPVQCEAVLAWEPTVSNTSLEFSESSTCCKRPGSVSCYPAAFAPVPTTHSSFTVVVDEAGSRTNWLSVGLCKVGFATSSSDGFGRTASSWGVADDRSKESEPAFFACAGHRSGPAPRKLKVGDKVTVTVDLVQGTVALSVNANEFGHVFGGLSSADSAHVGPRGDPRDFWFGATFANDHKLRVVSSQASPSSIVSIIPHVKTSWLEALRDEVSALQLLCLQQQLEKRADSNCSATSAALLEQEALCQSWLDNPLFAMGFVQTALADRDDSTKLLAFDGFEVNKALLTQAQCEQWELLHQLTDAPNGLGPSQSLVNVMKRVVMRDRGSDSGPNHIVHAAIAAMIWHEGHGAVALDLSRGVGDARPSKVLEQVWALAQDLRQVYTGSERDEDCERAGELDTPISMERQHSLPPPQEGQRLLNETTLAAVRRARLLMTFLPTKFVMGSSLKEKCRSSKQSSRPQLVIAESVLSFIKFGPDPDVMREVVRRRTRAARSRSEGFSLARELLVAHTDRKTQADLLRTVAASLSRISDGTPANDVGETGQLLHYLSRVRGSAVQDQYGLQRSWAEFVGTIIALSVQGLRDLEARHLRRPSPLASVTCQHDGAAALDDLILDSVLSTFAVLSLDYIDSHNSVDLVLLKDRGAADLFRCALASSSQPVRTVATKALELLLHSCSFALCADLPTVDEREQLKALLVDLVELQSAYLRQAAVSYSQRAILSSNEECRAAIDAVASKFTILRGEAVCDPSEEGLSAFARRVQGGPALCALGTVDHSYSVWLWCPTLDTEGVFLSKFDGSAPAWSFLSFSLQRGAYLCVELGGSCWTSHSKGDLIEPTRVVLASRSPLHCSKWVHVGVTADSERGQVMLYIDGCLAATGALTPQMAISTNPYADLLAPHPDHRGSLFFIGQAPSVIEGGKTHRPSASCVVANANLYLAALSPQDYIRVAVTDFEDYFAANSAAFGRRLLGSSVADPLFIFEPAGVVFRNCSASAPVTAYVAAPSTDTSTRVELLVGDMKSANGLSIGLCFADSALRAHSVYIRCDDHFTYACATFAPVSFYSGNISSYDPRSEAVKVPALQAGDLVLLDLCFHEDCPQLSITIARAISEETCFLSAGLSCLQPQGRSSGRKWTTLSREMFAFAVTASGGQQVQLLSPGDGSAATTKCATHDRYMCGVDLGLQHAKSARAAGATPLEQGKLCCWDVGAMMLQPVSKRPGAQGMVVSPSDFLQSLYLLSRSTKYMLLCTYHEANSAGVAKPFNYLSRLVLGEGVLQALVQMAFDASSSTARLAATAVLCQLVPLVNIKAIYRCFHNLGYMHFLHSADNCGYRSVDMCVAEMCDLDYMGTGQLFLTSLVQLLGLLLNPFSIGGPPASQVAAEAGLGEDALQAVSIRRGDSTFVSVASLPCYGRHLLAHQVHQILQALVESPISYWKSLFATFLPPLLESCQEGLQLLKDGSAGSDAQGADLLLGALAISGGWRHELGLFPGARVAHCGHGGSLLEDFTVVSYAPGASFGSAVYVMPDAWAADSLGSADETDRPLGAHEPEMVFASYLLSEQGAYGYAESKPLPALVSGAPVFSALLLSAVTADTADGRASPKLPCGSKDSRNVVFESPHPYRDAVDEFFEMSIPGATELTIVFHRGTSTESSHDYLRFYKDASRAQYYGKEKYSGGSGWPGVGGVDPLRVSAGSCLVHFHAERGSGGWGYRFMVSAEVGAGTPAVPPALPALTLLRLVKVMAVDIASKMVLQCKSLPASALINDSVKTISTGWRSLLQTVVMHNLLDAANVVDGATVNLSAVPPSRIGRAASHWQTAILTSPLSTSALGALPCERRQPFAAAAYGALVQYFQGLLDPSSALTTPEAPPPPPNLTTKGCDAEKKQQHGAAGCLDVASPALLSALAPSANSPMFQAADSASLAEMDSTSSLVSSAVSSPPQGLKYRLHCYAGTTHCRIRCLPMLESQEVGDVKNGSIVEISGEINGFYRLVNRSGFVKRSVEGAVDWERVCDGDGPSLCADVHGQLHCDLDAAVSLACYQLLCVLMRSWTIDQGAPEMETGGEMLLLLRVCGLGKTNLGLKAGGPARQSRAGAADSGAEDESPMLVAFMNMVANSGSGTDKPNLGTARTALSCLAAIASTVLSKIKALATATDASSVIPPPPPPPVVLESLHEYENNSDSMTLVHVPGASALEITFDPECSTERNYDYVAIYADDGRKSIISSKFSGRRHSSDKNWPGVDGRAPLLLEGRDKCWVSFLSDGSNTDWGWRLSVAGIFKDGKSALGSSGDFDILREAQVSQQSVAIPAQSRVLHIGGYHYRSYFGLALRLCHVVMSLGGAAEFLLSTAEGKSLLATLTDCASIVRNAHHSLLHLFVDINCRIFIMSSLASSGGASLKDDSKVLARGNELHFHTLADCVLHMAASVETAHRAPVRVEPRTVLPPPLMQAIAQAAVAAMSWKIKHGGGRRKASCTAADPLPPDMQKVDARSLSLLGSQVYLTHGGLGVRSCPADSGARLDKALPADGAAFAWGPLFPPSGHGGPYSHTICVRIARQFGGVLTLGVAPLVVQSAHASSPLASCTEVNLRARGPLGVEADSIGMQVACSSDDAKQCCLSACSGADRSSQECPSLVEEGDVLSLTLFAGSTGWSVDLCRNGVLVGRVDSAAHPMLFAESLAAYLPPVGAAEAAVPPRTLLAVAVMLPPDAEVVFADSHSLPTAARKPSADIASAHQKSRALGADTAAEAAAAERDQCCAVAKRWDVSLSDPYLVFSEGGATAFRPGSISCYPASLVPFSGASCSLTMTLVDGPSGPNSMSFGIAHASTFQKTSSDGMGQTVNSWGLIESRASGDGKLFSNRNYLGSFRKMKESDVFCVRYERSLGKAWLTVNAGEFRQEFDIHAPGEVVELVAGATFCNDHRVRIVDEPPPPLGSIAAPASSLAALPRSSASLIPLPRQAREWDSSLSHASLLITHSGSRATRPDQCSPFPAAFVRVTGPFYCLTVRLDECAAVTSTSIGFALDGFPTTGPQPLGEKEGSWGVSTSRASSAPTCTHVYASGALVASFREFHAGDVFCMRFDCAGRSASLTVSGVDGLKMSHHFADLPEGAVFVAGATLCSGTALSLVPSGGSREDELGPLMDDSLRVAEWAGNGADPRAPNHMHFRAGFVDNGRLLRFADALCCGAADFTSELIHPPSLRAMLERLHDLDLSQLSSFLHPLKASADLMAALLTPSPHTHPPPNFMYSDCLPFACAARSRILEVAVQGSGEVLVDLDLPEAIGFAVRVLPSSRLPHRRLRLSAALGAAGAAAVPACHMALFHAPSWSCEELLDCCDLQSLSPDDSAGPHPISGCTIGREEVQELLLQFRDNIAGGARVRDPSRLLPGDTVVRGPGWAAAADTPLARLCGDSDGSPGGLGDLMAVAGAGADADTECTVRWRCSGRVVTYPFREADSSALLALWRRGANGVARGGGGASTIARRSIVTPVVANRLHIHISAASDASDSSGNSGGTLQLLVVPVIPPSRLLVDPLLASERRLILDWYSGVVADRNPSVQQRCTGKTRNRLINEAIVKAAEAALKSRHMPLESLLNKTWEALGLASTDALQQPALASLLAAESASPLHSYRLPLSLRAPALQEPRGCTVHFADVDCLLARGSAVDDTAAYSAADPAASRVASSRFALLVEANSELLKCIDLVNMSATTGSSFVSPAGPSHKHFSKKTLLHLLREGKGLIFSCVKDCVISACVARSETSGTSKFELVICRPRAALFASRGEEDLEGRWSIFGQAFRKLHGAHPSLLRKSGQIWDTVFAGERAQDAGGPYREVWSDMSQDLMSARLPLLRPTPNNVNNVGGFREAFLLNPHLALPHASSADSASARATRLEMFVFLGKLLGIAARSKNYMDICLAPMVWKLLLEDRVSVDDLADVDYTLVNWLSKLKRREGLTAETFEAAYPDMAFTTVGCSGQSTELHVGGAAETLKWGASIDRYCEEVIAYKLTEMAPAIRATRLGLLTQLPQPVLHLLCWEDFEEMVCGRAAIDIALLKSITEYERGYGAADPHIVWLWELLESDFSTQDKKAFLRFTWGRAKLPTSRQAFSQVLKIQGLHKAPADAYLPVAHTCFFSIEIPRYSCKEIMREKLLYAIYNCIAIDGDETSAGLRAANMAAGWENV